SSFNGSQKANRDDNYFDDDLQSGTQQDYSSYSVAEQTSYFMPIKGTRFVLGGILTLTHSNLRSSENSYDLRSDVRSNENAKLNLNAFSGSFIAARRFGRRDQTSLGFQVEHLSGHTDTEFNYSRRLLPGAFPFNKPRDYQGQIDLQDRVKRS